MIVTALLERDRVGEAGAARPAVVRQPDDLPASASPPGPPRPPEVSSRRTRRNRWIWGINLLLLLTLIGVHLASGGGGKTTKPPSPPRPPRRSASRPLRKSRLDPDWNGDGRAVTLAFGGDVNFPVSTNLGDRLAADPATALGPTVPALLSGADLTMVNFESALTDGSCAAAQSKQYVFYAPGSAVTAFRHAGISLVTEANNHGEDCGAQGLQDALQIKHQSGYEILGIGKDAQQAFTPYEVTIKGQKIAIIAATQVIDSDLQAAWTATDNQAGLASAYDVDALISEVEAVRKQVDTVVVYLHWGTQLQACPNALQEPLAQLLVKAGADIIVGTHAHVLLGGGYLGSAYVDYGLGNFAFYNNSPPENASGTLSITVTGRHIDHVRWRPAVIADDLPQPLTGAAAATAITSWDNERGCTDATAAPGPSLATKGSETSPAPAIDAQPLSVDRD